MWNWYRSIRLSKHKPRLGFQIKRCHRHQKIQIFQPCWVNGNHTMGLKNECNTYLLCIIIALDSKGQLMVSNFKNKVCLSHFPTLIPCNLRCGALAFSLVAMLVEQKHARERPRVLLLRLAVRNAIFILGKWVSFQK